MRFHSSCITKRDRYVLVGLSVLLLAYMAFLTGGTLIFGSMVDWVSQHSVVPEYFRQHFYNTGELLPQFTSNLGAGQNIYNFAYYGYLNPIILVSYLMPHVPMDLFVSLSSALMMILSVWLFLIWLRYLQFHTKKMGMVLYDAPIQVATVLFAFASPLVYQSHKQIMFVDYMPFLILALIGVDRVFAWGKKGLLAVSVAALFLTSYFFAVPALVMLSVYGIFRYLTAAEYSWKSFFKEAGGFAVSVVTGVLLSGIVILPSLYAILSGRSEKGQKDVFLRLVIPEFPIKAILYSAYGIGMTAIAVIALVCLLIRRNNEQSSHVIHAGRFLAGMILICASTPIIRLALNGFLYARTKALIPFVPVLALVIAMFLTNIRRSVISLRRVTHASLIALALAIAYGLMSGYWRETLLLTGDMALTIGCMFLAHHKKKPVILYAPLIAVAFGTMLYCNNMDKFVKKEYRSEIYAIERLGLINDTLMSDPEMYRSNDLMEYKYTSNQVYNPNYRSMGYYSSLYNRNFRKLVYSDLGLANPTVNDISFSTTPDVLFEMLMGVRYVSGPGRLPAGYEEVASVVRPVSRYGIGRSCHAYSLGFAMSRKMSLREYETLSPMDRELALLQFAVVDEDLPDVYTTQFEKISLTTDFGFTEADGLLHVAPGKSTKLFTLDIPDSLHEYIYVVTMHISERKNKRCEIIVNETRNALSGFENSSPNDNFDFRFVISSNEPCNQLTFEFPANQEYFCTKPEIYRIPCDTVFAMKDSVDMVTDLTEEASNRFTGQIHVDSDSVLCFTFPFDEGFSMVIDGKETTPIMVDNGFVGAYLTAGDHDIELLYRAPLFREGAVMSILGCLLLLILHWDSHRPCRKKCRNAE